MRIVCSTIVTKNYLADARVLWRRLKAAHPEVVFIVVVADDVDGTFVTDSEPFPVILSRDVLPAFEHRALRFCYTAFEFCNLLRPFVHLHVFDRYDADVSTYLDADLNILGPLTSAFDATSTCSILLSPHLLSPCDTAVRQEADNLLLRFGTFNSGFLAVRRCEEGERFLRWLGDRLRLHCVADAPPLFVDQIWLNLVPSLFPNCAIHRDPGHNVGYWNVHERHPARTPDGWAVNGHALRYSHMSGWRLDTPGTPSTRLIQDMSQASRDMWQELGAQYKDDLLNSGYAETRQWDYSYGQFADRTPIPLIARRAVLAELRNGTYAMEIDPFQYRADVMKKTRQAFDWLRPWIPEAVKAPLRKRVGRT